MLRALLAVGALLVCFQFFATLVIAKREKTYQGSMPLYMAVLASLLHGFTVPAGVEVGQRLRGVTQGLFGWVKRAPWGDPGFSSLVLSVVVFGFVGGITGVTIGTEQINMVLDG